MGLFIIRTVGKFNRRKASIGGVIFFMFYSFLIFLFIYRGDMGKIVWSWILSMINLSPLLLLSSLYLYLKAQPINTKKMLITILIYVICLPMFFQLTILIAGKYESWMNGAFILLTVIYCIPLCKLIYRWWKLKPSSNESDYSECSSKFECLLFFQNLFKSNISKESMIIVIASK